MVFCPITQFTFPHTFSVQLLTGIIPTQAAYREISVRSLAFGKTIVVCGSNHPCPTTYDLEHHFQIFGDSFSTWLLSTIHHNDQPALNHHTFCTTLTRHRHCSVGSAPAVSIKTLPAVHILSTDSTTVQPQHPQNLFKTAFNQAVEKPLILTVTNDQKKVFWSYFQWHSLSQPSLFQPRDTILPLFLQTIVSPFRQTPDMSAIRGYKTSLFRRRPWSC